MYIPLHLQRLFYGSMLLEDGRPISVYGISSWETLHMRLALRGGTGEKDEEVRVCVDRFCYGAGGGMLGDASFGGVYLPTATVRTFNL